MQMATSKKNNSKSVVSKNEKPYFGFEVKKTKAGEPMFCEVMKFPKGMKLTKEQVASLHEAGFKWFHAPLAIWSRYVNPENGFATKFMLDFAPDATHPTHEEYAAFKKQVKAYYNSPDGLARVAAKAAPAKTVATAAPALKGHAKSVMTQFSNLSDADRKAILAALNA